MFANFDNRKTYFNGCGEAIKNATSLEMAIKLAKLDWTVEKQPIYLNPMKIIPNQFATVRTDENKVLGIVGKNYEILQNAEAFDFLDSLVGSGNAKFETAGYRNDSASFITCSTEPMKILGDEFVPYILFMNSFDGSGAVRVMFTPIRVFCSNCLVRAIKNAENKISVRHSRSMTERLEIAKEVLFTNTKYLEGLKTEAEKLAVKPFSAEAFEKLIKELFKTKEGDSVLIQERNLIQIEALLKAYNQADLQNFNNSAWKAIQAVADFESHKPVFRNTGNPFNNFQVVVNGMPLLNRVTAMIQEQEIA